MVKTLSMTRYAIVFALLALVALTPDMASALTGLETGVCTIVNVLTGKVGRAVATVGIIFLGIGAFFGKVNWGLAIIVAIGVMGIFGAAIIARELGNSATSGSAGTGC